MPIRDPLRLQDWTYLKIYLGEAFDRCDSLIVELVPKLLELPGIEQWFFIRYLDERGFHLRVRFRAGPGQSYELLEQAKSVSQKALQQLPVLPPSNYFPMVLPIGNVPDTPGSVVGIVADRYDPELDKFGGERGMPIAEELFEASSEIAVAVLRHEALGQLSRKTLAPCFMQAVADAFKLANSDAEFWQHYSFYWLRSRTPAAYDFRERFLAKGNSLRVDAMPIVVPAQVLRDPARTLLETWVSHLRTAATAFQRAGNLGQVTTDNLAFNFAHLMNNRLGLHALEEAYLATLLEQWVGGDLQA